MKSLWLLLHTAILSAISINPIQVSADQPATQSAVHAATAESEITRKTTYFQRARSYSTHPESDPPRYVRNLAKTEYEAFRNLDWLDAGIDHRTRYELRNDDIRRNQVLTDHQFLLRTRAYIGIEIYSTLFVWRSNFRILEATTAIFQKTIVTGILLS